MDISVIIVNYNTAQITKQCLDSIFEQTHDVEFEVIIVDNASTDESEKILSAYPNIKYVKNTVNLGFGKANNLGYNYSSGKYILLLNSDTILKNNAVKLFVDNFDKQPDDVACIGSWLLSPDGNLNNSYGDIPTLNQAIKSTVHLYLRCLGLKSKKSSKEFDTTRSIEVGYVMGADICIRRSIIERLGMFDPDFFMYYEGSEMQYRYHKVGYKAKIVPGPQIVHLECISTKETGKKYSYKNRRMFFTSYFLFMRKRYSYIKYFIFRLIFIFNAPIFLSSYYSNLEKLKMLIFICSPLKSDSINE